MRFLNSRTLPGGTGPAGGRAAHNFENAHHPYMKSSRGGRSWEDYYRQRWQHDDKVVRSPTQGRCTGSSFFRCLFVRTGSSCGG